MSVHNTCGAPDGSGVCQNDHHNYISAMIGGMFASQLEPNRESIFRYAKIG